ncbi:MAG: hypothetical protein OYH76_24490 [Defluviicoccus sp.]|nr:hypothetical protein [Defluviicoccus sp.]
MKPVKMLKAVAVTALIAAPFSVYADDTVTVREGDTADFAITVSHPQYVAGQASPKIRIWYDTDGGDATEGGDYEQAHSWRDKVEAFINVPVTISVKTFSDQEEEADETFMIRMRKLEHWRVCPPRPYGIGCTTGYAEVSMTNWTFTGAMTAVIEDVQPASSNSEGS